MNLCELKSIVANDMKSNWCGIETVRNFNKKNCFMKFLRTYIEKSRICPGKKKPMKYNVVRTII